MFYCILGKINNYNHDLLSIWSDYMQQYSKPCRLDLPEFPCPPSRKRKGKPKKKKRGMREFAIFRTWLQKLSQKPALANQKTPVF